MRVHIIAAFAAGKTIDIVNALPKFAFAKSGTVRGQNYDAITYGGITYLARQICSGVDIDSSQWDLWHILPASTMDSLAGPAIYRALRRAAISAPDQVRGPFDIDGADRLIAAASKRLRVSTTEAGDDLDQLVVPAMFAGDCAPEIAAQIKYAPSDDDCIKDTKPTNIIASFEEDVNARG